jgi:hypothetical protein
MAPVSDERSPGFGNPEQPRRGGRVRLSQVRCSLGEVLDLSATGMRIRARRVRAEQGAMINVTIFGLTRSEEVSARVVWKRRTGWFSEELGLAFEDLSPSAKSELAAIARTIPLNDQLRMAS